MEGTRPTPVGTRGGLGGRIWELRPLTIRATIRMETAVLLLMATVVALAG